MEIYPEKEVPEVVTEVRFKTLVKSGEHQAEVVCKEKAYRKDSVWYGTWVIRAVSEAGTERLLVPARRSSDDSKGVRMREFRTIYGLVSFLQSSGFDEVTIPLNEGRRSLLRIIPEDTVRTDSND